jgi:aminomethyltransferase
MSLSFDIMSDMEKHTSLYNTHIKLGGRMVPFAGYMLPIQYETGILKEHKIVRASAGIFDVSHMGEFLLEGEHVSSSGSNLFTNDVTQMTPGKVLYSPMCNTNGGVVDDLLIYMFSPDKFMLVVNAVNIEKDFTWIKKHLPSTIKLTDISDDTSLIAIQGRKSAKILNILAPNANIPEKSYTFTDNQIINGINAIISRTGYTGEDGFEFYINQKDAPVLFEVIMETGREFGLTPCGLGARDTLRLEASLPLYGHEMNDEITPLEAGLSQFVKMDDRDFIGKQAMLDRGTPTVKLLGLELTEKGIARERCVVYAGTEKIGEVTSGTMSPYTGKAIAMALINTAHASAENMDDIKIEVRGRLIAAKIAPMPFYKKNY